MSPYTYSRLVRLTTPLAPPSVKWPITAVHPSAASRVVAIVLFPHTTGGCEGEVEGGGGTGGGVEGGGEGEVEGGGVGGGGEGGGGDGGEHDSSSRRREASVTSSVPPSWEAVAEVGDAAGANLNLRPVSAVTLRGAASVKP